MTLRAEHIACSFNPIAARGRRCARTNPITFWIEQCEAARTIRERFGLEAAFDYAVGEKLMNFPLAARDHPAFAKEFPRFISEVRRIVFGR
jgi:hypothetical protein